MQRRQLNATLSARCKAVNAGPLAQCKAVNAGPLAQCSAVSSMQRRQLTAGPSGPVNSMQGPSVSMQARLFQCRAVSSMQGGLSAEHRNCSMQGVTSMQCRAVCSMQGPSAQCGARLLNKTPFCSTQGRPLDAERSRNRHLKAGDQLNARLFVSMQGRVFQWRAHSMQDHHVNAGPPGQRRTDTSMHGRLVGLTKIF